MMMGFMIWSIGAVIFLIIGISGWKSKEAVGFFTFLKPPVVTDVNKYNHSVSILWVIAAVILEIIGIPFLFSGQNSAVFIFVILGAAALVIGMMIAYVRIEKKYGIIERENYNRPKFENARQPKYPPEKEAS